MRVRAGEVRKRLGMYYATAGAVNPIRIELPSGSYVPGFRRNADTIPVLQLQPEQPPEQVAATVSALIINYWRGQFWASVFKCNGAVSLCVAYMPVYGSDREPTVTSPTTPDEFVKLKDQFVGSGDLIASVRLSSMLSREKRSYLLKVRNDVSFHDLRTGPAVLIGHPYTRRKEISSQMRYFIDTSKNPVGIADNGMPTVWTLPNLPRDRKTDRDFAIVSRVFHQDATAMLVELASVTSYGTDAAGDLVTSSDSRQRRSARLPRAGNI